jgi:hypothetical protein
MALMDHLKILSGFCFVHFLDAVKFKAIVTDQLVSAPQSRAVAFGKAEFCFIGSFAFVL